MKKRRMNNELNDIDDSLNDIDDSLNDSDDEFFYENKEAMNIINYWFYDGKNRAEIYRLKWFSTGIHQEQCDKYIKTHYTTILLQAEQGKLTKKWTRGPLSTVALIIVLDQFSRHIYRNNNHQRNDKLALQIAHEFLNKKWFKYVSISQNIFALMPLRHSLQIKEIEQVLHYLNQLDNLNQNDFKFIKKIS